ncbi:hypothetical protein CAEBREN_25500 [Caenorhabditis brenneri]|uniref:JmjC domain-containing protein n=1 Tax=Caenorhabditis brenneri TaxID=135651 RepID=G0N875_CAEBE|nr:hypothetical protein CAEBREN_25500 [Caenorhabditis brenneri]
MEGQRSSLRCASSNTKAKLRSSTRVLPAPSTQSQSQDGRSSSRSSRSNQAVSSTATSRSQSRGKARGSSRPAGPRPLPDHTQLDLPERTPEERIEYFKGCLENIYNGDPCTRRIGERLSSGVGAAEIVEEEIGRRNMRLRATLAMLQSTSPAPGDSNQGSAGTEERVQHYEAALEYICKTDPVSRRIGEKLFRGIGADQIVEEKIERKNMRLQAILAILQNSPSAQGPNHRILSRSESSVMDDMEPSVPQFGDFDDGNQNLEVPGNDSRPDSPMNIDHNPHVKGWLHVDDMEDDPYWAAGEHLRPYYTPPADSPGPVEAHEMEENLGYDEVFDGPLNQELVDEETARSPSRTPKFPPIYGHRGLIEHSMRGISPEQAPQDSAPQDNVVAFIPNTENNGRRKQVMVEQDVLGRDVVRPRSLKPIKVEEPSPDHSFSTTPAPSEVTDVDGFRSSVVKTDVEPNAPSSCSSVASTSGTFTIAPKAARHSTEPSPPRNSTSPEISFMSNPRMNVSGRPDFPGLRSFEAVSGPITYDWVKAESPDNVSAPVPSRKTKRGRPMKVQGAVKAVSTGLARDSSPDAPGPSPSSPIPGPSSARPTRSGLQEVQFEKNRKAWLAKLRNHKPGSKEFVQIFAEGEEKCFQKWAKNIWPSGRNYRELIGRFEEPHLFETKDDLHLVIPNLKFEDLKTVLNPEHKITVIVGGEAAKEEWTIEKFLDKFENWDDKEGTLNNLSLEVTNSHPELSEQIVVPEFVREHSIVDKVEGLLKKRIAELEAAQIKQTLVTLLKKKLENLPQLQKYLILSTKNSFTDIHIDFSASSVYYHVVVGKKIFYFCRPTKEMLEAYKKNELGIDTKTWLGEKGEWYRVEICAGQTAMLPSSWPHYVFTPVKSIVIGGNFLTEDALQKQFDITKLEEQRLRMDETYEGNMYRGFRDVMWTFIEFSLIPDLRQAIASGAEVAKLTEMGRVFLKELHPVKSGAWTTKKQNEPVYNRLKKLMDECTPGPSTSQRRRKRASRKRVAQGTAATVEPTRKSPRLQH